MGHAPYLPGDPIWFVAAGGRWNSAGDERLWAHRDTATPKGYRRGAVVQTPAYTVRCLILLLPVEPPDVVKRTSIAGTKKNGR